MRIPEHRTRHRRRGNNAHTPRPAPAGSCRRAKGCMAGRASPRHEPRGQRQGGSGHLPHPPCAPAAARGRADSALSCGGVAGRWAAAHASLIRGQRRAHARALQPARGRGGPSVSATTAGRQRVESVLAPPQAAGGALVEGGHRVVGRADLQLLVVGVVVAALGAVGCRGTWAAATSGVTRSRQRPTNAEPRPPCTYNGTLGRTHLRSGRRSSKRPARPARRPPPFAPASPRRSPARRGHHRP